MAAIHKLSVRGIRAFSPEDEEQVISFGFPLTIIVGANGCGKTTIIEALKYAITGSLPPGNKSGQAFVHDPKGIGTTQVKAAIKLRFQNRAGKSMVVVRSMELTQKKTTMTFKALDGIIRTSNENGTKVSLSHKCSELDRQIPQLLGVSKAILEHVVFCHQEDSSWPLQEGAVLKKRFDDIFDSTKYVKALEALKEEKKKYVNIVKEHKIALAELNGHKHASMNYRTELDECKHSLSDIHDEMKEFQSTIDDEQKKCQGYQNVVNEANALRDEIEYKLSEYDKHEVRISTHKKSLEADLTQDHNIDDLQNMLRAFDRDMHGDEKDLEEVKRRIGAIKEKIEIANKQKMDYVGEKGLLLGERKIHDNNLHKRIQLMEELATKYGLELDFSQSQSTADLGVNTQLTNDIISMSQGTTLSNSTSFTNIQLTTEDLQAYQRSVENKRQALKKDLEEFQGESQKAEDAVQAELSALNAQCATIENELSRLSDEREKASKELRSFPRTTSRMRKSEIDEARHSADKYAKIRNELNNDPRRDAIPKQIAENESKISKIKIDIDELNIALKELRKCAEDQHNIDILEKQVRQDLELLDEIKSEHSFLVHKFQIKLPDVENGKREDVNRTMDTMVAEVTDMYDSSKNDLEGAETALRKSSARLSEQSALLSHKQETLVKRKDQLSSLSKDGRGVQQIKNVIKALRQFETSTNGDIGFDPNSDPQQLLQYFTMKIGELSVDGSKPESVVRVIKKLKKLSKVRDASGEVAGLRCPCCTRALDLENEFPLFQDRMDSLADPDQSELIKTDENTARLNRSALNNYTNWRNIISKNINDWLDYQRISDEIERVVASLEKDEEDVSNLRAISEENQDKVNSLKDQLTDLQQVFELVKRLRDEVVKITSKKYQIFSRKEEIKLTAPRSGGRDLNTTERELNAKVDEKEVLSNSISSYNKELSDLNDRINQANNSARMAEKLVSDKEKLFAQEQESITKRNELNNLIGKCKEKEEKLQNQIAPMKQKVQLKDKERARLRQINQSERDKRANLCSKFNSDAEKIDVITKQIEDFQNSDSSHRIDRIDVDINNVIEEIKDRERDLQKLEPLLKKLDDKVSEQETHRKNVERNIELLDMLADQQKVQDEINLIQEQLGTIDLDSAERQLKAAQQKIRKSESERDRRIGSRDSLQCQLRDLKRKLQTPEYNNIDERHRVKMIETETCSLAVEDLDTLYNAYDKALLKFHGYKIREINKIIKELWSLTYRGEDITNIHLTSDQDSNSRSSRSYNYRVVMTKGTTELDMRGRCSAGQRVLASIVIRLALAETFCLNCGVMALDEPTTNLDYANKRGLATALAQIIAHRAAQDNFQLVIITHDEDFVSMMKNELATHTGFSMPERYFQVSREESNDGCYYSKIKSIDWDEL